LATGKERNCAASRIFRVVPRAARVVRAGAIAVSRDLERTGLPGNDVHVPSPAEQPHSRHDAPLRFTFTDSATPRSARRGFAHVFTRSQAKATSRESEQPRSSSDHFSTPIHEEPPHSTRGMPRRYTAALHRTAPRARTPLATTRTRAVTGVSQPRTLDTPARVLVFPSPSMEAIRRWDLVAGSLAGARPDHGTLSFSATRFSESRDHALPVLVKIPSLSELNNIASCGCNARAPRT